MGSPISLPAPGNTSWYPWAQDIQNLIDALANGPFVTVGGYNLTASQKRACTFACDDTNETTNQDEINAAIALAYNTRNDPRGGVFILGKFGANNKIIPRANTTVRGCGWQTSITAKGNNSVAMIENETKDDNNILLADFSLHGNYGAGGTCSGISLFGSDGGGDGTYDAYPGSNPDMLPVIQNVHCAFFSTGVRHGIHLRDNVRGAKVSFCEVRTTSGHGFFSDGASDGKFDTCLTNQSGAAYAGFKVAGGSNQYMNCKTAYAAGIGWDVSSSRANLVGCHAQDAGEEGFNITGTGVTATHLKADSNSRLSGTAWAIRCNTDGMLNGVSILDRNQSVQRQDRGLDLTGANDLFVTGKVSTPTNTNEVTGTPTNSYARVLRAGAGVYSVG